LGGRGLNDLKGRLGRGGNQRSLLFFKKKGLSQKNFLCGGKRENYGTQQLDMQRKPPLQVNT